MFDYCMKVRNKGLLQNQTKARGKSETCHFVWVGECQSQSNLIKRQIYKQSFSFKWKEMTQENKTQKMSSTWQSALIMMNVTTDLPYWMSFLKWAYTQTICQVKSTCVRFDLFLSFKTKSSYLSKTQKAREQTNYHKLKLHQYAQNKALFTTKLYLAIYILSYIRDKLNVNIKK